MNKSVWIIVALLVSVSINLLLSGMLVGRHLAAKPGGGPHMEWMLSETDDKQRAVLKASMREHFKATASDRRALRTAQSALRDVIAAEPYNQREVEAALANLRRTSGELQLAMHQQMATVLGELEPAARTRLLHAMTSRRRHGGPPGGPPSDRPDKSP